MDPESSPSRDHPRPSGAYRGSMTAKLVRPRDDRIIAGVCSGLGRRFDISPNVIRLIFIAFLFLPGSSVIAYLVLWLLIPSE